MDEFANILERDYGLKPQGKMAPMSNVKPTPLSASIGNAVPAGLPRNGSNRRSSAPILADDDPFFGGNAVRSSSSSGRHNGFGGSDGLDGGYDDVFGGPPKFAPSLQAQPIFEDIFRSASQKPPSAPSSKGSSSYPVFDAPIYDDDIFGGMPGIRSVDSAFEDVFNIGSAAAAPAKSTASNDDLLGGFGSSDVKETINSKANSSNDIPFAGNAAFDDLLPGFGAAEPAKPKSSEDGKHKISKAVNSSSPSILEDPFAVFNSDNVLPTNHSTSASNAGFFEAPARRSSGNNRSDASNGTSASSVNFVNRSPPDRPNLSKSSVAPEKPLPKESKSGLSQSPTHVSESADSNDGSFYTSTNVDKVVKDRKKASSSRAKLDGNTPASSAESASAGSRNKAVKVGETDDLAKSRQTFRESTVSPNRGMEEATAQLPKGGKSGGLDEFWISIEDVKLVTQPTAVPPPVRPPPAPGPKQGHTQRKVTSFKTDLHDTKASENGGHFPSDSADSVLNDREAFVSGSSQAFLPPEGSAAATASGAAVTAAIERAEVKLRQAMEAKDRDKGEVRGTRYRDGRPAREREDGGETKAMRDKEEREREERDREARERLRKEREREEREREERDREKQREREKEREREREKDRANELARQRAAVERANAEVRDREAQKAAERARAVEKARAAERAATERAEREKAEKERAAAAAAKEQQGRTEDDLDSFFKPASRPTSAPKQRTHPTQDGFPASQQSNEGPWRSSNSAFNVKKVPSMPSMADDLTSLFGGPPAPGTFQEVAGEPADRRRARWERDRRTADRAAKALEEKHQRDLQSAKDQEERHRAGELVDAEIRRWAAGKEGNLRALLSSLHYVLWPECGWQPVSLTDLITAAAVKKVYKKANLFVHPDKVQQRGATNQQKYIAEKVFDLLKEASNKFNSEELF